MNSKELFGRRVRDLRRRGRLTQEKLAELADIDISYLGNIERGNENPTITVLEKLANALHVKTHQILNFDHELVGEKPLRRRLNQILDRCDEGELRLILKIVGAIKE